MVKSVKKLPTITERIQSNNMLIPLKSRALHLEHFERNHVSRLFAV